MNSQELVERVRSSMYERDKVMDELFRDVRIRANTQKFILANGGERDDAETVLCDSIVNFVKNCYKEGFEIRSTIENYLFGVTKNLWFKTIRERKPTISMDHAPEGLEDDNPEILLIESDRKKKLEIILQKMDEKCRQVLTLWAKDMKMQAISKVLNYSSAEVVRKKKHLCLKRLIEIVQLHPGLIDTLKN
jgi:DNA-directed RNA polymerase specialized sigma24 family protein